MPPLIQLENFSYAYPQVQPDAEPVWVLDGVDLTIEAGEFVAVMGRTGCGKTTLCLALNGIVPHSTGGTIGGTVTIAGQNSKTASVPVLAQTVGIVFQEPETQLFNMTVEAEIAFGLETMGLDSAEMHQRIDWALGLVGMKAYRQHAPFELSGGQKQRVAIAAILAMKPPLLVLDEPTANLDPLGKREVFAAVETLRQQEGMTIVMVSHDSEQIAAFADRVVVLDEGRIILDGSPQTIFTPAAKLAQLGLSIPQVSQLADQLNQQANRNFAFTRFDDAHSELATFADALEQTASTVAKTQAAHIISTTPPQFGLQHVSFRYDTQHTAINNLSLTIQKGTFTAILGQNGSGKTTLMKLLNGLLRPLAGNILLDGVNIAARDVADLAHSVGYVFQNPDHMIFSPTVRDELAIGPRNLRLSDADVEQRVEQALRQFGLQQYADQQPATLSFGLRRKVSVAAVMTMQTGVLILDEPTSGLDQRSSDELMTILKQRHAEGNTILMITHDMQLVAQHVPHCIVLHEGRLLLHDDTRNLFQQTDLLRQAQLEAPQITQLGTKLGLSNAVLTVDELCQQLTPYVSNR